MGQPPSVVQAGPPAVVARGGTPAPADAADSVVWMPIAREHYNTSLVRWMTEAGGGALAWLEARTRSSPDPGLVMVTEEVYDLWKGHAVGAGAPFPRELLRGEDDAGERVEPGDTPGWRASLVLVPLVIILFLVVIYVIVAI